MTLTVKNRDGLFVEYTLELSEDLKAVHGLDATTILRMMHGTEFTIIRKEVDAKTMNFILTTNDKRDEPYIWEQKV